MSIKKTSLIGIVTIALVLSIAFASVATAWPPNLPPYDSCYALVIGISDYQGTEDDMDDAAVRDAREFYWHLLDSWQTSMGQIRLRTNSGADQATIDSDFNTLFDGAGPNDIAIVYWGGHGGFIPDRSPLDESDNLDGALETYDLYTYTDDELAAKINAITAGTKVVILDSCHMGEFSRELNMENTIVILSTRILEGTESYVFSDPMPTNHKPFSYYFNRADDTTSDGVLTIEEAFEYAYLRTVAISAQFGNSQHPILIDNVPGDVAYLDCGW